MDQGDPRQIFFNQLMEASETLLSILPEINFRKRSDLTISDLYPFDTATREDWETQLEFLKGMHRYSYRNLRTADFAMILSVLCPHPDIQEQAAHIWGECIVKYDTPLECAARLAFADNNLPVGTPPQKEANGIVSNLSATTLELNPV